MRKLSIGTLAVLAIALLPSLVLADGAAADRAGWLLDRSEAAVPTLHRAALPQSGVGGVTAEPAGLESFRQKRALPFLLSALVPGLGEATMGYRHGYVMMAADVAAWIGVKHYHDLGYEKKDEYLAYADVHWSEDKLAAAFGVGGGVGEYPGTFYYGVDDYQDLSLWIPIEADEREYYENLGKWDQFVFGWDDFFDPINIPEYGLDATSAALKDPRVSAHREIYRALRKDSNDQFDTRDKLVYFNMLMRVFSLVQVAWLQGVFGGDGDEPTVSVGGHEVGLIAQPLGTTASRVGVTISY